jgi:hypothetical protein
MKRLVQRLLERITQKKPTSEVRLGQTGAYRIPAPVRKMPAKPQPIPQLDVEYSTDIAGKIVDGGPGKNVLIRNKYVREDSGTHETLKIVDDSLLDNDDEVGLDPYNTGRFDRARSWNSSRSRK